MRFPFFAANVALLLASVSDPIMKGIIFPCFPANGTLFLASVFDPLMFFITLFTTYGTDTSFPSVYRLTSESTVQAFLIAFVCNRRHFVVARFDFPTAFAFLKAIFFNTGNDPCSLAGLSAGKAFAELRSFFPMA